MGTYPPLLISHELIQRSPQQHDGDAAEPNEEEGLLQSVLAREHVAEAGRLHVGALEQHHVYEDDEDGWGAVRAVDWVW